MARHANLILNCLKKVSDIVPIVLYKQPLMLLESAKRQNKSIFHIQNVSVINNSSLADISIPW